MSLLDEGSDMREEVNNLPREDLEKEIGFAQSALDYSDPNTVYWLALLFDRHEKEFSDV